MKNDDIDITYSTADLKIIITKLIAKHPHSKYITDCIFEELSHTEVGLKNLLLAQQGCKLTLASLGYTLRQKITVETIALPRWRMDVPAMEKAQIILNNTIECTLIDFNRTKENCFQVHYKAIDDSGDEYEEDTWIRQKNIKDCML